jgi:molecular chaperone GrpE
MEGHEDKRESEAALDEGRRGRRGAAKLREELEALRKEIEQSRQEADQLRDRWMRAAADLENYRKRSAREREELARFAHEGLLKELLPILDNLGRALDHGDNPQAQDGMLEGVRMVQRQFAAALERAGVTPIVALNQPFDPALHEAVMQVDSAGHEPNMVVQEMERGYRLHDRLLRPSKVAVSRRS